MGPRGHARSRSRPIRISGAGTAFEQVFTNDGCTGTAAGALSFGSTQVTFTGSCPAGVGETIGYTSTATTLRLFNTMQDRAGPVREVQVFTLQ